MITLTTLQAFLGIVLTLSTVAGIVFAAGKFVEKASGSVTTELKYMNQTLTAIKEDLDGFKGSVSRTLTNHGERLARMEGRQ